MDKINFFPDNLDVQNKKIILRLDLNVPLKDKIIADDTRIVLCLPFIKKLIEKKSKIIIISHLGRPKGVKDPALSLMPIYKYLKKALQTNVYFFMGLFNDEVKDKFSHLKEGEIILIENIRFYLEEEKNDTNFAKHLSKLADIFVNDAFSCSHRAHASVNKITKFLPSYAGLQLETEIKALKKVTTEIKKPITCIIGGSKISTKIGIIKNFIPKFDNIIIVGGMANTILNYLGNPVGKSIKEDNCNSVIENIFETAKKYSCKIVYPVDVVVGKSMEDKSKIKELNEVNNEDYILDIGPKTINKIKDIIESSKTILWNGPAGYFENPSFALGSYEIAKKIVEKNKNDLIYSIAGGGDTIAVLNQLNVINNFNFVSTAGGAFLEYLEGKELPGIKALK